MQTKHTPGPWYYELADRGDASVGIDPTPPYIFADPDGDGNVYPICTIDDPIRRTGLPPAHEYDECMEGSGDYASNARLIASAPELLSALRMLDDHFSWLVEHDEHKNADLTMQAVVRAAIAKATGADK